MFAKEKLRQYALWGGLGVMSIPTLPLQAALQLYNTVKATRHSLSDGGSPISDMPLGEWVSISAENSVNLWANEQARKLGLEGTDIYYERRTAGRPVIGAQVTFERKKAQIYFLGDPHVDKTEYIKFVVAHELGHLKAGEVSNFRKFAMNTVSTYGLMAEWGLIGGLIMNTVKHHPLTQNLSTNLLTSIPEASMLSPMNIMTASLASLLVIPTVSKLAKRFNHSVEHLADMKAAEDVGPDNAILSLYEAEDRNKPVQESSAKPVEKYMFEFSLTPVWNKFMQRLQSPMHDTHPTPKTRRDFIRAAFDTPGPSPELDAISHKDNLKPPQNRPF